MAKHTGPPESRADSAAEHSVGDPPGDSEHDFREGDDPDLDPGYASPPGRFGRLALWAASASALSVGVAATVAYGVWFDQDQRAYTRAMAVAQQTVSTGGAAAPAQAEQPALLQQPAQSAQSAPPEQLAQPAIPPAAALVPDPQPLSTATAAEPTRQTAWVGQVVAAPPADRQTPLADAAEVQPTTSVPPAQLDVQSGTQPDIQPEALATASSDTLAPRTGTARPSTVSGSARQVRHHPAPRVKSHPSLFARMESYFHRVNYRQHGNGSQQHQDLYAHS